MQNETTKIAPQTSQIISRINDKITSLYEVLSPVIMSQVSESLKDNPMSSGLILDLQKIEDIITELLDSIKI